MRGAAPLLMAACVLGVLGGAAPAFSQIRMEQKPMSQTLVAAPGPAVAAKLAEYDKSLQPETLKEAADAAALHDGETPPDPALAATAGRSRLADWIAILGRVKRDLPEDFDPNRQPVLKIGPPGPRGTKYPPGIPPERVKEPELRAAYEEAIRRNQDNIRNFSRHYKLFEADQVIRRRAAESVADARATLGLAAAEARAMLEGAALLPEDRQALVAAAGE